MHDWMVEINHNNNKFILSNIINLYHFPNWVIYIFSPIIQYYYLVAVISVPVAKTSIILAHFTWYTATGHDQQYDYIVSYCPYFFRVLHNKSNKRTLSAHKNVVVYLGGVQLL